MGGLLGMTSIGWWATGDDKYGRVVRLVGGLLWLTRIDRWATGDDKYGRVGCIG